MPPEPPPPQELVTEQLLIECGLDARGFTVKYEEFLQSVEVVIQPEAGATADNFECIFNATGRGYDIVTFRDHEMYSAYLKFVNELLRPETQAISERELQQRGLLEGMPRREHFDDLTSFALALEAHAGFDAGEALAVTGEAIELRPPMEDLQTMSERSLNLMAITSFASSHDRVEFFLIGNATVAPEEGQ